MFNNAKTVHDILAIQQWMSSMELTIQKAKNTENMVDHSNPPQNDEAHDSNDEGTAIEISLAPMFHLDDDNLDDIQQPIPSDDFIMVIDDDESSGSQHSTSKPKPEKKKKIVVSRKEFLSLQGKVDQILAVVATKELHSTDVLTPQSLIE